MHKPPQGLCVQTQTLLDQIRKPLAGSTPCCRYASLVRDHVFEVVQYTFPLFYAQYGSHKTTQLADQFVVQHEAQTPLFHHIATEWVQFCQQNTLLPAPMLALLEYEWALFSIEIDEHDLKSHMPWSNLVQVKLQDMGISLNETLHMVAVPFEVLGQTITFQATQDEPIFYGLFRNRQHQILTQRLYASDVAMTQWMKGQIGGNLLHLMRHIHEHWPDFDVLAWVRHYHHLDMIDIYNLGEQHDPIAHQVV